MSERNKVEVKIYGQTYTIAGDANTPKEYIIKVAKYVNEKMDKVAAVMQQSSTSNVAVLAALNIAEDLYRTVEEANEIQKKLKDYRREIGRNDGKISNYQKLWEETQKGFVQSRQELQAIKNENQQYQVELEKKTAECETWEAKLAEVEAALEKITTAYDEIKAYVDRAEQMKRNSEEMTKALADKEREFENEFIEMQKENMHLKSELEKYRKDRGDE